MKKTIFSLVTLPITQNVAIIRISGPKTYEIVSKIIKKKLQPQESKIIYQKIILPSGIEDEVLLLCFKAPHSFTGENLVEIQCHGSLVIVNEILKEINSLGGEQAIGGDFLKQAFFNKKVSLLHATTINSLILSKNEQATREISKYLNNNQLDFLTKHYKKIEEITMILKVAIDNPEIQDLPKYNLLEINSQLKELIKIFSNILEITMKVEKLNEDVKLVIIGDTNSGKSSFINSLLKQDISIVSSIKGTTRDTISDFFSYKGITFKILDTAGIRKTKNEIEIKGIKKTISSMKTADFVFIFIDLTQNVEKQISKYNNLLDEEKIKNRMFIYTKNDLNGKKMKASISSKQNDLRYFFDKLDEIILKIKQKGISNYFLFNDINRKLFESSYSKIKQASNLIEKNYNEDLILIELEESMKLLGKIIGINVDENYINMLFSTFCVGK